MAYVPVRVCRSQSQAEQTFWIDLSSASGGGAFIFRGSAEMTLLPARGLAGRGRCGTRARAGLLLVPAESAGR